MSERIPAALPDASRWGVVWTKPRCEKDVFSELSRRSIPCFLPTFQRKHIRPEKRDVRSYDIPLFPGYVFLDSKAWFSQSLPYYRHVVSVLESAEPENLRSELSNLSLALSKSEVVQTMRLGGPGRPVTVTKGPLKGLSGVLVHLDGSSRLVIKVTLLSIGALLSIDESMVEPVIQ